MYYAHVLRQMNLRGKFKMVSVSTQFKNYIMLYIGRIFMILEAKISISTEKTSKHSMLYVT